MSVHVAPEYAAVCEEGELKPVVGLLNGEDRYLTAGDDTDSVLGFI